MKFAKSNTEILLNNIPDHYIHNLFWEYKIALKIALPRTEIINSVHVALNHL